eukprot:CAMPEP_0119422566 /NCGR_PEP_ID=MMETSP1335-20130426/28486_1 /TAXON_ID=259385 /ORGANISM="Chrysoculter rhomboideus, Strain RCC1486" /LENGTH=33 /DNA_ID= /DNA_START= /DNA_END= /DNA_ORIENTATION=
MTTGEVVTQPQTLTPQPEPQWLSLSSVVFVREI